MLCIREKFVVSVETFIAYNKPAETFKLESIDVLEHFLIDIVTYQVDK